MDWVIEHAQELNILHLTECNSREYKIAIEEYQTTRSLLCSDLIN